MAITTLNLISRQTVGSAGGVASITFSNIPQTFTDLKIVVSGRTDYNGLSDESYVKLNGSSASIYTWVLAYSSGTASAAATDSAEGYGIPGCQNNGATSTANVFCNGEIYIPNYTSANHKRMSLEYGIENNATATNFKAMTSGLWASTAAVTSVSLSGQLGNYVEYSTFSLYGISSNTTTQNTSVPSATGGDVITTDGTYWYHAFKYSGTFTPLKALTADYLVVAGGGGGGMNYAGGGGAGGLRCTVTASGGSPGTVESALSLTAQAYTVTVGAGGAGASTSVNGTNGSNSVFSSITSTAGGGGGAYTYSGSNGGSGGGGPLRYSPSGGPGGTGTQYQGYAGGTGQDAAPYGGGGGGGAGAAGATGNSTTGGAGGNGVTTSISGTSTVYAGGGGGSIDDIFTNNKTAGPGGTGGGGTGARGGRTVPTAGTVNLGAGGGGGSASGYTGDAGAAGGSGIVVVRYAV